MIIIDGSCASFHILTGDTKQTIFKKEVSLPKKHGRGGQSQNRFARIREEKRDWYTSEIAEFTTQHFIDRSTNLPNVKQLVMGGSASLKSILLKKMDKRLSSIVLRSYDIQYSGEIGFNEVLRCCVTDSLLTNCRFAHETTVLENLFKEIATDGLYALCTEDVMYALEAGAVEKLVVWNELPILRVERFLPLTSATKMTYYKSDREKEESGDEHVEGAEDDASWKTVSHLPLLDWILDNYASFGSNLEIVSQNSCLGGQFKGLGGIAALLRYPVDLPSMTQTSNVEDDEYEYDF